MNERQAFLRAVSENPDDDAPRLVYADWLDEHGEQDQAELIRVSCQLAHVPVTRPMVPLHSYLPPDTARPPGWIAISCWPVRSGTARENDLVDVDVGEQILGAMSVTSVGFDPRSAWMSADVEGLPGVPDQQNLTRAPLFRRELKLLLGFRMCNGVMFEIERGLVVGIACYRGYKRKELTAAAERHPVQVARFFSWPRFTKQFAGFLRKTFPFLKRIEWDQMLTVNFDHDTLLTLAVHNSDRQGITYAHEVEEALPGVKVDVFRWTLPER